VTLEEILQKADEEIHYPGEEIIERFFPGADRITDYICSFVLTAEDLLQGKGLGESKKVLVMAALETLWAGLPIPLYIKPYLKGLFDVMAASLVDMVVDFLNNLFEVSWPTPEEAE